MKRTVIITGGTRGIGAAVSLALKEKGYKVIANYNKNNDAAREFAKLHAIPVYQWDVGNYEDCVRNLKDIEHTHGPIDTIVHNAGVTADGFFHKMTPDMWNSVIQTNLGSCFNMVNPLIDSMRQRGFGRIVLLSSVSALKGQMGQVNYCAAKAGIIGFTKALALESASKGITVNAIAPGYIETDMIRSVSTPILHKIIGQIPSGRLGQASEIARCVAFLVDEGAGYITGETLNINGGQYLS
ncbi:MAG: acetoacetyl-CoA reductase [Alphaproteobacteria bacterium]|nr:acetoacetyl-CoA reductase [Alphaproteobacteria bacterium]